MLREFDGFLKPDSLFIPDFDEKINKTASGFFSPLFADLDSDGTSELICLLAWDENYPSIAVIKKIGPTWYLLYLEDFYMFYSSPELYVGNSSSKNKTFCVRKVYNRGSGVYEDGYSFYKLINNTVYPCLDIVNDAHIVGWGLNLNQTVSSKFSFRGGRNDDIWVMYNYNFFAGPINNGDCGWCSNEEVSIVKGEKGVNYIWDNKLHKYKREVSSYRTSLEDLSDQKIACFSDMGNDKLFVRAFRDEINETLKKGTREQRAITRKYLSIVKREVRHNQKSKPNN
ncbi:hypothetical protein ACFQZI_19190 [Mucilaginibacter lutimaris]|uniref:Uncharacterized protein n=1 Tax=Mucilaginibacter lutimaris TaxID=931629 RepID=A0ABW2ZLF9_9SPHI